MASGGIGSSILHPGTVEYVVKDYGFIKLNGGNKAYFDRSSVGGSVDNLRVLFSRGDEVKARIVITDGAHKVKFKAKSLILEDSNIRGGDHYLKKYLLDEGPEQMDDLVESLHSRTDNCPKFLKKGNAEEVKKVVRFRPDWFEIKNGFVCLTEAEKAISTKLLDNMPLYASEIPFDVITSLVRPDDVYRKYLNAKGPLNQGVKDFVARNAETFIFWNGTLWTKDHLQNDKKRGRKFQEDLEAVKYYSQFVIAKGPLAINSLSGHYNQASDKVKKVTKPKEADFKEFLERNSFFFPMQRGDIVKKCPEYRLSVIDSHWAKAKPRSKASAVSMTASLGPLTPPPTSPSSLKYPIQASKAFSDANEPPTRPEKLKKNSGDLDFATRLSFETSANPPPSLSQRQNLEDVSNYGIFRSPEARIFEKLVGKNVAHAIQEELLSNDTLNSLLLLRLNIGKPPMAKFRIPGEASGYNHTLKMNAVKSEDVQRILRHDEVVKMNAPFHYGVKGTLHSIRTVEQDGRLAGLTLFCQLHEESYGLEMDIWKGRKLTAYFTGNYHDKYLYNCLRCRSKKLSKRGDVLVIDMDGQLSGCDEQAHSSLGNVTRVMCSSSADLLQAITVNSLHMHDDVIIIGVDTVAQLEAILKMCSKGTKVTAEVASNLKSKVKTMFT